MAPKDDDDAIDLKEVVRLAKVNPVPFAMAPGKAGLVLITSKRQKPEMLVPKVKKAGGEGAKLISGTLAVKGSEMQIQTAAKVTPAMVKLLKALLKSQGIQLKPTAPGVEDEDD